MRKTCIGILTIIFVFLITCCTTNTIVIYGIDNIEVGCSAVFEVEYEGSSEIIWSSSDEEVATVIDGVVIGHKPGNVTITAQAGNAKDTYEITVIPLIYTITINGNPLMKVGDNVQFDFEVSREVNMIAVWSSSDNNIIEVSQNGIVTAKSSGSAFITVTIGEISESINVTVMEEETYFINVTSPSSLETGHTYSLEPSVNSDDEVTFIFKSLTPDIIEVSENGIVKGLNEGKAIIEISVLENPKSKICVTITITDNIINSVKLNGKSNIVMGEHSIIDVEFSGNGSKEIEWFISNPSIVSIYHGIILGLQCGSCTIKVQSTVDNSIYDEIEISVSKYVPNEIEQDKINKVNEILGKMSLSQKIGQMFFVGFSGTSMSSTLSNAISNYNFGNVIYMGANVANPTTLTSMSNAIQNKMVSTNTVPAFISTDQEGGRVARLTNGGTHFISQMAIAATNNPNNAYLEGQAVGEELLSYGINMDFAPVLDVNNNPDNPIIGIRSYADNPLIASLYGNQFIKGLHESNVTACPKHFPGHGNTAVDSHYGLPIINSSMDELYQIELAPFISAIKNGIDAIMTTHIIFEAIDKTYPATLSEKVLTGLLRNTLNYDGLIITDGMEMDAIKKYFGSNDVTSVQAVKAGVDILLYTSINGPITAHTALMNAVKKGEITEERINESVRRILLAKLERGILDNYITTNIDRTNMLQEHSDLNLRLAIDSLTQVIGKFEGLDKNKSTLIVSPTTTYSLGSGLESNSFACYASKYLLENGHSKVDYVTTDKNISDIDATSIGLNIHDYDQIVVAFSNVKTSSYTKTMNFINSILSSHDNVIVIALDTPYDALSYNNKLNNYICVYGYQQASVIALSKYLNGEFDAQGVSPVDESLFKK